jgi:hypothetical protein
MEIRTRSADGPRFAVFPKQKDRLKPFQAFTTRVRMAVARHRSVIAKVTVTFEFAVCGVFEVNQAARLTILGDE